MRLSGHFSHTLAVALTVACLLGGALALSTHQRADPAPTALEAAAAAPAVRLTASTRSLTTGGTVTFTITTSTKHKRPVRLQRWNAAKKTWATVATRTVSRKATTKVKPATGTFIYRAYAPKITHTVSGRKHTHRAATSAKVSVVAKPAVTPSRPVTLTADETTLYTAVHEARLQFARAAVNAADTRPELCLTTYARAHSAWMAAQRKAIDPSASGRAQPGTSCTGRTVRAVTRAIGSADSTSTAVSTAVTSLLRSPYGEMERLLSTCDTAPAFEFGVGITTSGGVRWITVLVSSATKSTTASGACA